MHKRISRKTAIKRGLNTYFDGKVCKNGHRAPRYVLSYSCTECHKTVYIQKYWKKHDRKKYSAAYYRHVIRDMPERIMIQSAKSRAKKAGVPMKLTTEDIIKLWPADDRCPILGVKMVRNLDANGSYAMESPSLDRIIPSKGYVPGNVAIISMRANAVKGAETDPEVFRKVANWIESHK